MKLIKSLFLIYVLNIFMVGAQSSFEGTLKLAGAAPLEGSFDAKIDKSTRTVTFTAVSGKSYEVLSIDGAELYYKNAGKYFKTLNAGRATQFLEVLVYGDARLYQSLNSGKTYVENVRLKTGMVAIFPGTEERILNSNRGKLLVIFQDCVTARERTNNSPTKLEDIRRLVNVYNNCDNYSTDFQLTRAEQTAQTYAEKSSIVRFDAGLGLFFLNNDIRLTGEDVDYAANDHVTGMSVFASLNFSPNYLYSLMDRLYFNVSLQYNFKSSLEFEEVSQDFSNLNLMFAPRFYFGNTNSKFRPYLGFGVGMSLFNLRVEDLSNSRFENFDDNIIQFMHVFQAGVQFSNHFELSVDYFPYFNYSTLIQPEAIRYRSTFDSVLVKLSYRF